jgi:hypothetical protein
VATQNLAVAQDTTSKPPAAPHFAGPGNAAGVTDHLLPFHTSARGPPHAVLPTARHATEDEHATPFKMASPPSGIGGPVLGDGMNCQLEPFQRVNRTPSESKPTATQNVVETH